MSVVRFIADLHLGHENMAIKRGFANAEEHDEYIIKMWNSVVNKRDLTYILGDVTMERTHCYPLLKRLNGMKKVVLGNHDKPGHVPELLTYVQSVSALERYKGIWLSHCPVHPMELEYRVQRNIHGHIHEKVVLLDGRPDPRYHCVSCERVDFVPRALYELGIER